MGSIKTLPAETIPEQSPYSSVPVERKHASELSYHTYLRDYVAKNRPVVIEDAVREWLALRKWTPEYFKTKFGPIKVDVSHHEQMTFSDFIDAILASSDKKPGPYMYRLFIGPHMPTLLPDVLPLNTYAFPGRLASPLMPHAWRRPDGYLKLLIGGVGGKFPVMHFDGENMHASITEIYGDKEFIMYAPEDTPYLYPTPEASNLSQIDNFHNPDFTRFPLFAKATRYSTILRPGEMIFVPSRWWHTARVVSTSISVCQNMLNETNWRGYVNWLSRRRPGKNAVKRIAYKIGLSGLGAVLTLLEMMPFRGTQQHPSRIARLAPKDPYEASPVSEWRINNWVVRR